MGKETFLGEVSLEFDPPVRGDPITGDRYYSKEYMQAEWERLWTRVWHVGGLSAHLLEPGDYVVHNFIRESVVMVCQEDRTVKAFYNACRHRGNRLVWSEIGASNSLTCSYHGWKWDLDGTLLAVQDPEDVVGGNPCGRVKLVEIPCESWGGFVWFNMDEKCRPLREWLNPLPQQLAAYGMDKMVRVMALTAEVNCNWKIIRDNFNESYHLPTLHPELRTFIDDDYTDTVFEMYRSGHNRMIQKGAHPSKRGDADAMQAPLDQMLREWDIDPNEFEGRAKEARLKLQSQKRKLGKERGITHFDTMSDSQLTDYYHYTLFPNLTITMSPDGFQILRTEPHPTDPEKCIFDHWYLMPHAEGRTEVETPIGRLPFADAERIRTKHGDMSLGFVADQDLAIAVGQQEGLHSRGYTGGFLTGQEKRIQRFHELLNDYLKTE